MQSWSRTESAHLCDTAACLISHLGFSPGKCAEGALTPCGASHIKTWDSIHLDHSSVWLESLCLHMCFLELGVETERDFLCLCRVSLDHTVVSTWGFRAVKVPLYCLPSSGTLYAHSDRFLLVILWDLSCTCICCTDHPESEHFNFNFFKKLLI